MGRFRLTSRHACLLAMLVCITSTTAHADFVKSATPAVSRETNTGHPQEKLLPAGLPADFEHLLSQGTGWVDPAPAAAEPIAQTETPANDAVVQEIPPAPSSLALGLTALAGFGAYHASRSIRKLCNLTNLPDWYHAEGKQQIGHAKALDIESWDQPACAFEAPAARLRLFASLQSEAVTHLLAQSIPLSAAPRGPPAGNY